MIYRKHLWLLVIIIFFLQPITILSLESNFSDQRDERKVSLIYYGLDQETAANVHFLDSILSGLFEEVEVIELKQFELGHLDHQDIVIYYSVHQLSQQADIQKIQNLRTFTGFVLGIGPGATDLPQYEQWSFLSENKVHKIEEKYLDFPVTVLNIDIPNEAEVIAYGESLDIQVPIIIKDGRTSFINLDSVRTEVKFSVTRSLYQIFDLPTPAFHPAYLRLEDISPVADPDLVLETGMFLIEKGIPVYLAVIPVYLNPETGEEITIEDTPELKKVLEHLVNNGAYIISHGYTHTYRYSETGEGFEFWDSVANQPITTLNQYDPVEEIKQPSEFANLQEYETYIHSLKQVETEYTQLKLTNSIHSLTKWGFPPVAFEAPHYTMSSNGYKITSEYFSALFGQLQVSDQDWRVMISPLFISQPSILDGMTLYPETIGFVDLESSNPIEDIENAIQDVTSVPGAVIGGFYHPYLGLEYLEELVHLLEQIPNLQWIELNQTKQHVETEFVQISLPGDGQIQVIENIPWQIQWKNTWKNNSFEVVLWGVVILTTLFVLLFTLYIFTMRFHYRKRLFKERL